MEANEKNQTSLTPMPWLRCTARPRGPGSVSRARGSGRFADVFPHMTGLADEFAFSDADERFELLIDIFVDGLARRAVAG